MRFLSVSFFGIIALATSCMQNEEPIAIISYSPNPPFINQTILFDASKSSDQEDFDYELAVRWDFTGDNNWETDWDYNQNAEYTYNTPGTYKVILAVKDSEGSIGFTHLTLDIEFQFPHSKFVDDRDGIEYETVLIDSNWWMCSNLNHGIRKSPGNYEKQLNNGIIEKYHISDKVEDLGYGGFYLFREAMDYTLMEGTQGICPSGWRIPTNEDWNQLISVITNNSEPKILEYVFGAAGLDLLASGIVNPDGLIDSLINQTYFWSSSCDLLSQPSFISTFRFSHTNRQDMSIHIFSEGYPLFGKIYLQAALPLRCLKD